MRITWTRMVTYFIALLVAFAAPLYTAAVADAATTTSVASNVSGGGHVKVIKRSHAPKAARSVIPEGGTNFIRNPTGTQNVSADWSWWHAGWTVKFNRTETNRMAWSFGTCTLIVGAFLPNPWALALYVICGTVATAAGFAALYGDCLTAWVPVSGINTTLYRRNC